MSKIASLLMAVSLIAGCQFGQPQSPPPPVESSLGIGLPPVTPLATRANMLVSTRWLAEHLNDGNLVVLHVGRPATQGDPPDAGVETYRAGHVPGARFVPWRQVATTRDGVPNELPPLKDLVELARRCGITHRSRIVLYDDKNGLPAARAYVAIDYLGLGEQAALLDGQWKKWSAEDRPISLTEPATSQPSGFVPRPRPAVVLHLPAMRDLVWERASLPNPPVVLVDARAAEEFTGRKPGEAISRPGHIPGAANVFWVRNLVSEEMPEFRSPEELRAIYAHAGALPGSLVVTYCRTGGQASMAYFAAKYIGHDVSIYDGSFYEWSRARGTAVAAGADE